MEVLHRVREATAQAVVRLTREPGTQTRWILGFRIAFYVLATALLMWELYLSLGLNLRPLDALVRIAAVTTIYGLGRWPVAAGAISLPLVIAEFWLGRDPMSMMIAVPFLTIVVLIATRPRQFGYLYMVIIVAALALWEATEFPLADFVSWLIVFLLPCLIGEGVRFLLRSVEGIRAASAEQLARQRRDLARELHDTSIHDITAMIMALERAKLQGIDNPKALEEIDHAIATGRQSVVSMRGVLKILRSADVDVTERTDGIPAVIAAATPTVERALEDARTTLARAGNELLVHIEDQLDQPMPFSVRTALVRVIQECTANMAKYAQPGTPCTVMIERNDTETRALFINHAPVDRSADPALSSGVGLIGARERVEAVGGSLVVRHHDGRWIIQTSIPTITSASEGQVERAAQH